MPKWFADFINITIAALLVIINGFFVSAEFALVKVREARLEELVKQKRLFADTALWLLHRLDASLSACQLGITMASLGLGWIGEPAVARLLRPSLLMVGIESEIMIHGVAFAVAFTAITAAHLVLGEQAPKIFALRRPEIVLLWCALPLKLFYYLSFPFMVALNASTSFLLHRVGVEGATEHEAVHSEEEIRALLSTSHLHGELSRSEHRLINAVFQFDDMVCRKVMIPRSDVIFFDEKRPILECIELAMKAKHSRYPVCKGTLDEVLGVVHIKDLIGVPTDKTTDLCSIIRKPQFVPETLPISRLLRQFQATRQHLAFVVNEYGTIAGIVTLETVLEQIVGPVEDEFDMEPPDIVRDGPNQYIVRGSAPLELIHRELRLEFDEQEVDTFAGLLMTKTGEILAPTDRIELAGAFAEVLEVEGSRATRIRVTLKEEILTDDN